jgi:hypothetical protein
MRGRHCFASRRTPRNLDIVVRVKRGIVERTTADHLPGPSLVSKSLLPNEGEFLMNIKRGVVAFLISAVSVVALANAAPWYQWNSNLNGKIFCAQTSPGEAWTRDSGPYKDARYPIPGTP